MRVVARGFGCLCLCLWVANLALASPVDTPAGQSASGFAKPADGKLVGTTLLRTPFCSS